MDQNQQAPQTTIPPSSPHRSNTLVMVLAALILLGVGAIGGYLFANTSKQLPLSNAQKVAPTNLADSSISPEPTTDVLGACRNENYSLTTEDKGVKMTLSPTCGKVGSSISVSLNGLPKKRIDCAIRFTDSDGSVGYLEDAIYKEVQTTNDLFNGIYTITIPEYVLAKAHPDEGYPTKKVATKLGKGAIHFGCVDLTKDSTHIDLYLPLSVVPAS